MYVQLTRVHCMHAEQGSEHEDYVMEMIDREADGSDSLEVMQDKTRLL